MTLKWECLDGSTFWFVKQLGFFYIRYACVQLQAIEREGVDCGELFAGEKSQKCPRNRGTFFGTVEFFFLYVDIIMLLFSAMHK